MRKRHRLRRRYGRSGADPDYILMYGGGATSLPFVLLDMAIDEARALSKPGSYGGEVFVVERRGPHTRELGVARNGRYVKA